MVRTIEKLKKSAIKRAREKRKFLVHKTPKHLYSVIVNNNRPQKKEAENKPEQKFELGLPPQPKEYLKYPDYDWF